MPDTDDEKDVLAGFTSNQIRYLDLTNIYMRISSRAALAAERSGSAGPRQRLVRLGQLSRLVGYLFPCAVQAQKAIITPSNRGWLNGNTVELASTTSKTRGCASSFPRSAWECRPDAPRPLDGQSLGPGPTTRSVEDGIPTRSVGTRSTASPSSAYD